MTENLRQSNIELCRLVSILLVMVVHTTYQSLGPDVSLGLRLVAGFSLIGVNVFVLITGYFSTTPKKISLLNLAFICLFWMVIRVSCLYLFDQEVDYSSAFFITSSNWFIPCYIGLVLFSPILNRFCETTNRRTLWTIVLALLFIEMYFDWLPPYPRVRLGSQYGYSLLSFIVLYLLARAIKLYGLPSWFKKLSPLIYVVCSVLTGLMIHYVAVFGFDKAVEKAMAYTNPLIVLSSVAFFMIFEQMNFHSRFVNHLAKSTLACLLGHSSIYFLYTKQFKYLYDHYSGYEVVAYWVTAVAIVFVASILIDQIRLLMWTPIERWLNRSIKKNNIF